MEIKSEIKSLFELSLNELLYRAHSVHRENHKSDEIRFCVLCSIKTGKCPEDCAYCPQSAHNKAQVQEHALLSKEKVLEDAERAIKDGASHFCMAASGRNPSDNEFEKILELIKAVAGLGLKPCCTLGLLTEEQAFRLAEAGLDTYNHNIDTSPDFYKQIIKTRKFEDRLATVLNIQKTGIKLCCGGIIGMGESLEDRIEFIKVLKEINPHTIPINALTAVSGTPLENQPRLDPLEMVRMVSVLRISVPKAKISLAAGRRSMSPEAQALCFFAGANSIPSGEKLLTTDNFGTCNDTELIINKLGMKIRE